MLKRFLFYSILIFTAFACSKDDNNSTTNYSKGTFIVNEGLVGSGTGTITYLSDAGNVEDLYAQQNEGRVLGNIAQSMIKFDNKYFIAVNNASKIVVVNANDFKYLAEIKIDLPRYFAVAGNKLYVTSWTSDFSSGFINLINAKDFSIQKSTPIQGLVENMAVVDQNIYATVSASAWDQYNHHVIRYDIQNDNVAEAIEVGDNSNSIVADKNGDLWVLCSGFFDWNDPANSTHGSLHKISGNKSVFNISLSIGVSKLAINNKKDALYYLFSDQVLSYDINTTPATTKEVFTGLYYSLAVNPTNDHLYLLNAKDYTQNGELSILNTEYKVTATHKTGIIPSFVYFSN